MQFDILLNSRTYSVDYRWIARPSFISETLCEKVRDLMLLLERAGNMTDEDYLRNIFFFADDSGGILVRGGYAQEADKFGRQIYSVEGIACPAGRLRQFWYALPALIAWMSQCPLFRDTWVYGMPEASDLTGMKIDIGELYEEDLFRADFGSGIIAASASYVEECIEFLREDVRAADTIFSFAFIPGGSAIYLNHVRTGDGPGEMKRIYTKDSIQSMQHLLTIADDKDCEASVEDDGFYIDVQILQAEGFCYACLSAKEAEEGLEIAYMDKELTFGPAGLELSRLESAAEQLRQAVSLIGYTREV